MSKHSIGKLLVPFISFLFIVALLPFPLMAQNPRGSLRGIVQDASGAAVPSARIVVQAADTSLQREVTSNDRGEFRIDDLLPGTYHLVVNANGFAEARSEVRVAVSSVRELTVRLKLQPVQQSITLELDGPSSITTQAIDTPTAMQQPIITSQYLESIPLAARSFANIAYLAPGTEPVEPSDPTKARITAVSTAGGSGLKNDLTLGG